jgi:hypothetical protein
LKAAKGDRGKATARIQDYCERHLSWAVRFLPELLADLVADRDRQREAQERARILRQWEGKKFGDFTRADLDKVCADVKRRRIGAAITELWVEQVRDKMPEGKRVRDCWTNQELVEIKHKAQKRIAG